MRPTAFCLLCLLLLGSVLAAHAEELVESAQRELRARKIYFGTIDGRASDETAAAIFKFQRAKGLAASGHLDLGTLRALGLRGAGGAEIEEAALLEAVCDSIVRYLEARQSGVWERERVFYSEAVNYFSEGVVDPEYIKVAHAREDQRWPVRKLTLLNRIASLVPSHRDEALVTVRVRSEVSDGKATPRARTEDWHLLVRANGGQWRIAVLKLLE